MHTVGHDTVDMERAHRVADVRGMQHCLDQQHPVLFFLKCKGPCISSALQLVHVFLTATNLIQRQQCKGICTQWHSMGPCTLCPNLPPKWYNTNIAKRSEAAALTCVVVAPRLCSCVMRCSTVCTASSTQYSSISVHAADQTRSWQGCGPIRPACGCTRLACGFARLDCGSTRFKGKALLH